MSKRRIRKALKTRTLKRAKVKRPKSLQKKILTKRAKRRRPRTIPQTAILIVIPPLAVAPLQTLNLLPQRKVRKKRKSPRIKAKLKRRGRKKKL